MTARSLPGAPQPVTEGLLDGRVLLASCGENAELLQKMCQTLVARLPVQLAAMQDGPARRGDAARFCARSGSTSCAG